MAHQNDSFIDEVTEDLRRDRLFTAMRRYGWVVLVVILAIVAGAAWREYSRARTAAEAQAFGDALLAAEAQPQPADALRQLATTSASAERKALAAMLAADAQAAAGDRTGAAETLRTLGADQAVTPAIRDLARLKALALGDAAVDPAQRDAVLSELSAPGAPYRLLALEQKAVALVQAGRREDAVTLIGQIQQEQGLSENLRRRLAEMMITLGVEEEPAPIGSLAEAPAPVAAPVPEPAIEAAPVANGADTGAAAVAVAPAPAAAPASAAQTAPAAPAASSGQGTAAGALAPTPTPTPATSTQNTAPAPSAVPQPNVSYRTVPITDPAAPTAPAN